MRRARRLDVDADTRQTLIGRSPYRGIVEFLRDLLGVPVSISSVHDVLQAATRQASAINQGQDLSGRPSARARVRAS